MSEIQEDWHGVFVKDCAQKLDAIIYRALQEDADEIRLITGIGPLRYKIVKLLEEQYKYDYYIPLNNVGIIAITIKED